MPLALLVGATWAVGVTTAKPVLRFIDALSYMLGRWLLVAPAAFLHSAFTGALHFAIGMAALAGFVDSTLGGLYYLMAMQRTPA